MVTEAPLKEEVVLVGMSTEKVILTMDGVIFVREMGGMLSARLYTFLVFCFSKTENDR